MKRNDGDRHRANFERVSLDELVGSSAGFAEQVRRSRDVLEGGSLVRRMREMADEGAGISQEELARRLGLSQARISAIERGGGPQGPTYELLKRVARACGLALEPTLRPQDTEEAREASEAGAERVVDPSAVPPYRRLAQEAVRQYISGFGYYSTWTPGTALGATAPGIEVGETDVEVRVDAALPGVEPEDIEVTVNEDLLTIRAEGRKGAAAEPLAALVRSIRLPFHADPDATTANFRQGLLSIAVRKPAEVLARARRIAVASGSKTAASEE